MFQIDYRDKNATRNSKLDPVIIKGLIETIGKVKWNLNILWQLYINVKVENY